MVIPLRPKLCITEKLCNFFSITDHRNELDDGNVECAEKLDKNCQNASAEENCQNARAKENDPNCVNIETAVKTNTETQTPEANSKFDMPYRTIKLVLIGLALATYGNGEQNYFHFCSTMFQFFNLGLSASGASYMVALLYSTFIVGRFISMFLSFKFKPDNLIWAHYCVLSLGLGFLFFAKSSTFCAITGTGLLGYGFSAIWPAYYAFVHRHFALTNRVSAYFSVVNAASSLGIPLVLGHVFQKNPQMLLYLEGGYLGASFVFYLTVKVWLTLPNFSFRKLTA